MRCARSANIAKPILTTSTADRMTSWRVIILGLGKRHWIGRENDGVQTRSVRRNTGSTDHTACVMTSLQIKTYQGHWWLITTCNQCIERVTSWATTSLLIVHHLYLRALSNGFVDNSSWITKPCALWKKLVIGASTGQHWLSSQTGKCSS